MDMRCPYCRKSLKWKLLPYRAPDRSPRFFQRPTIACCVYCGGSLAANPHPNESVLLVLSEVAFLGVVVVAVAWGTLAALWFAGVSVVLFGAGAVYVHFRYLRNWPRYMRSAEG
jgi:hypothetical protein